MNTDDLYRILRTGHAQAQGIVDTISDPLLVLDGGLCVQAASRSFFETFHVDRYETIGKSLFELGNGQWDNSELRRLLLEVVPRSAAIIDFEVVHDFAGLGRRTMLLTARTLHEPDGGGRSILLSISDVTERRRADAAKDLLFGELRHRIKNLLGLIQVLAQRTTTEGRTAEQYRDDLLGRLGALIEAENFALDEQHETGLRELIGQILAPYAHRPESVAVQSGPDVVLSSRQVMSLSLVLHELATNAAKYGALCVPEGQVSIGWELTDGGRTLELHWRESGGPPVNPPGAAGFGSSLIQSSVRYNLRGTVELDHAPDGLTAEITIPMGVSGSRNG